MRRALVAATLVAVVAPLLSRCAAPGPSPDPDGARPIAEVGVVRKVDTAQMGADLYRSYCLNCHGEDARGGGAIAQILKVPTPDLTTIAARNDGQFPAAEVLRRIDGTDYVQPHGTGLMPVWGTVLNPDLHSGRDEGREVARRQITAIVEYLKTIQK